MKIPKGHVAIYGGALLRWANSNKTNPKPLQGIVIVEYKEGSQFAYLAYPRNLYHKEDKLKLSRYLIPGARNDASIEWTCIELPDVSKASHIGREIDVLNGLRSKEPLFAESKIMTREDFVKLIDGLRLETRLN